MKLTVIQEEMKQFSELNINHMHLTCSEMSDEIPHYVCQYYYKVKCPTGWPAGIKVILFIPPPESVYIKTNKTFVNLPNFSVKQ